MQLGAQNIDLGGNSNPDLCSQASFDANIVSVILVIYKRLKLSDYLNINSYQRRSTAVVGRSLLSSRKFQH